MHVRPLVEAVVDAGLGGGERGRIHDLVEGGVLELELALHLLLVRVHLSLIRINSKCGNSVKRKISGPAGGLFRHAVHDLLLLHAVGHARGVRHRQPQRHVQHRVLHIDGDLGHAYFWRILVLVLRLLDGRREKHARTVHFPVAFVCGVNFPGVWGRDLLQLLPPAHQRLLLLAEDALLDRVQARELALLPLLVELLALLVAVARGVHRLLDHLRFVLLEGFEFLVVVFDLLHELGAVPRHLREA